MAASVPATELEMEEIDLYPEKKKIPPAPDAGKKANVKRCSPKCLLAAVSAALIIAALATTLGLMLQHQTNHDGGRAIPNSTVEGNVSTTGTTPTTSPFGPMNDDVNATSLEGELANNTNDTWPDALDSGDDVVNASSLEMGLTNDTEATDSWNVSIRAPANATLAPEATTTSLPPVIGECFLIFFFACFFFLWCVEGDHATERNPPGSDTQNC